MSRESCFNRFSSLLSSFNSIKKQQLFVRARIRVEKENEEKRFAFQSEVERKKCRSIVKRRPVRRNKNNFN